MKNDSVRWVIPAAVLGLTAVGAGAFGAHVLRDRLDQRALAAFETATQYQMYHALALLGMAWYVSLAPSRTANWAGTLMLVGVVLFSGSLYGLTLLGWRWLGPVTPLGGGLMMIGWFLWMVAAVVCRRASTATRSV